MKFVAVGEVEVIHQLRLRFEFSTKVRLGLAWRQTALTASSKLPAWEYDLDICLVNMADLRLAHLPKTSPTAAKQ